MQQAISHDLITAESRGVILDVNETSSPSQITIQDDSNDYTKIDLKIETNSDSQLVRFVVLSDTHRCQGIYDYWYDEKNRRDSLDSIEEKENREFIKLPKGDYLLHCGDFTNYCLPSRFEKFLVEFSHKKMN